MILFFLFRINRYNIKNVSRNVIFNVATMEIIFLDSIIIWLEKSNCEPNYIVKEVAPMQ